MAVVPVTSSGCRVGDFPVHLLDRLVVKRVARVAEAGAELGLRLRSTNPEYADDTAPAGDVQIVDKVLWAVRRV